MIVMLTAIFNRSLIRWALAFGWTGLVFALMLTPGLEMPKTFLGDLTDKAAHFTVFAIFFALWYFALERTLPAGRALWLALAVTLVLGTATEVLQGVVPGRRVSAFDLVANWAGALGSTAMIRAWLSLWLTARRTATPEA